MKQSTNSMCPENKYSKRMKMLTFLEMNGIRPQCTDDELVDIGLSVASGMGKVKVILRRKQYTSVS